MAARKRKDEDEDQVGGIQRRDPGTSGFRGGKKNKRDKWWNYNDPVFKRWYHRRRKKDRYFRNVETESEMEELYREWEKLGKPDA